MIRLATCLLVCFAAGCASAPAPDRELFSLPSRAGARAMAPAPVSPEMLAVEADYRATIGDCRTVLNGFEDRARAAQKWSLGMHIAGAIAGVLAPFTGGSTTVAMAAIAGTMNTMPALVERDGLDAGTSIRDRATLSAAIGPAIADYSTAIASDDVSGARAAVSRLVGACTTYWITAPGAQ